MNDIQCLENCWTTVLSDALFSVCWSLNKPISQWKMFDIDHILIEGDEVNKSLSTDKYLNVDKLPREITIHGHGVHLDSSKQNSYFLFD